MGATDVAHQDLGQLSLAGVMPIIGAAGLFRDRSCDRAPKAESDLGASQVALRVKNPPANAGDVKDAGSVPGKIPWRRKWQPTPVFLPGQSHGQRSYSLWGHKESDMTEETKQHERHTLGSRGSWNQSFPGTPRLFSHFRHLLLNVRSAKEAFPAQATLVNRLFIKGNFGSHPSSAAQGQERRCSSSLRCPARGSCDTARMLHISRVVGSLAEDRSLGGENRHLGSREGGGQSQGCKSVSSFRV